MVWLILRLCFWVCILIMLEIIEGQFRNCPITPTDISKRPQTFGKWTQLLHFGLVRSLHNYKTQLFPKSCILYLQGERASQIWISSGPFCQKSMGVLIYTLGWVGQLPNCPSIISSIIKIQIQKHNLKINQTTTIKAKKILLS